MLSDVYNQVFEENLLPSLQHKVSSFCFTTSSNHYTLCTEIAAVDDLLDNMSTKILSDYFHDDSVDSTESIDYEFYSENREKAPESLQKNNVTRFENKSVDLSENIKKVKSSQQQESKLYESNEKLVSNSLCDETYCTSEAAHSENDEISYSNNHTENPALAETPVVNYSNRMFPTVSETSSKSVQNNVKKISEKNVKGEEKDNDEDGDENDDYEEDELVSFSSENEDVSIHKDDYRVSRNSPVQRTINAKGLSYPEQNRHTFHNELNNGIYNMNDECIKVAQIANALKSFDKKIHRLHIRPPWRDPNSKPLPSDRTTAFYTMYEDYLKYQNQRPFSSIEHSTSSCINTEIAVRRLYHSTLNRYRQNEKIQMENYELAKRLQKFDQQPPILPPKYQQGSRVNHRTYIKNKTGKQVTSSKSRSFIRDSHQSSEKQSDTITTSSVSDQTSASLSSSVHSLPEKYSRSQAKNDNFKQQSNNNGRRMNPVGSPNRQQKYKPSSTFASDYKTEDLKQKHKHVTIKNSSDNHSSLSSASFHTSSSSINA
ncbi:unnamed protein product [Heterobilharzia americana]|nr:unnamed protein product [Heterobilharzia americana]